MSSRARPVPPFSRANPGVGNTVRGAFAQGQRAWEEAADVLVSLAKVLQARGVAFEQQKAQLDLANGLTLRPQFVRFQLRENGAVSTTSTIEINHPVLCPPRDQQGTFEYQHAGGSTLCESLESGFKGWADMDLPVFMDALREQLEDCTAMEMNADGWTHKRQIILGPPVRAMLRAPKPGDEEHEFCPCCLLTQSFEAFREPIEGDGFCGVRLFASRDQDGLAQADCRINGVDWPQGAQALRQYVSTWPGEGLEYRKQYVAIRSLPL